MSDLLKRLQFHVDFLAETGRAATDDFNALNDAVSEIERLEAEVERLRAENEEHCNIVQGQATIINRLRTERDQWKAKWEAMAAASLIAGTMGSRGMR